MKLVKLMVKSDEVFYCSNCKKKFYPSTLPHGITESLGYAWVDVDSTPYPDYYCPECTEKLQTK